MFKGLMGENEKKKKKSFISGNTEFINLIKGSRPQV